MKRPLSNKNVKPVPTQIGGVPVVPIGEPTRMTFACGNSA